MLAAVRAAFPGCAPAVTVNDASSHTMAWLPSTKLATVDGLYVLHDLQRQSIVNAALADDSLT